MEAPRKQSQTFAQSADVAYAALRGLAAGAPLLFFGALLLWRMHLPTELVFDETHYLPASKALIRLSHDTNSEHPPFAKYVLGFAWLVLTRMLGVLEEPTVFRLMAIGFGLWALWAVRAWMLELHFGERAAQVGTWLTGFNFLWFVQSRTATIDIFFVGFALWGLRDLYRTPAANDCLGVSRWRRTRGWVLLGTAVACKWAAIPLVVVALLISKEKIWERIMGGSLSIAAYSATFLPLFFLDRDPVVGIVEANRSMIAKMSTVSGAMHPYASHWWEWPILLRPIWYMFTTTADGEQCIWVGGNPALYWVSAPVLLVALWFGLFRKDPAARVLSLLYWIPLLFWAATPRRLLFYYYYLVPSLWLGPMVVWAHQRFCASRFPKAQCWVLGGFLLVCAALFLFFLPMMDGRLQEPGSYMKFMWFRRWI